MFAESADVYDFIYNQFKDYSAEAAQIASLVRSRVPSASSILDIACGTGEHALHLSSDHGFSVDGIDVEPKLVEIAARKHPAGRFRCADMVDFDMGRVYDAVLCLFSSIGYVRTIDRIVAALRCFAKHLRPTGLLILEPSFAPGQLKSNHVMMLTADTEDRKVCRISRTEIEDRLVRLHFDYLIADSSGTRHLTEQHVLGLFTVEEMRSAFHQAGLEAKFDPSGLTDRGLFVAQRAD